MYRPCGWKLGAAGGAGGGQHREVEGWGRGREGDLHGKWEGGFRSLQCSCIVALCCDNSGISCYVVL